MDSAAMTFTLGDARITILDSGLLPFDMATELKAPEAGKQGRYAPYFAQPLQVPMQHVLVQTPLTTLLVDAGSYDLPDDMRLPGYIPPPPIPAQLRALGVDPARVQHLVITHLHLDHYNGLTEEQAGRRVPAFPKATVYVGAADWNAPKVQTALAQPESVEAKTLGVVAQAGRLVTVDRRTELAPGLVILPMPGETPGHLGVRIDSQGQVLYSIGDLVHHGVEVEQPAWAVTWADPAVITASRQAIFRQAAAEKALLIASHIPGAGRVTPDAAGWSWEAAPPAA